MASYSIEGIVLRHADYRENDRMLTLLTPRGRVDALSRGCKRPKSPLLPCSEVFTLGNYELLGSKNHCVITSCLLTDSFYPLRLEPYRLTCASYMAALCQAAVQPGQESRGLYALLLKGLYYLTYNADADALETTSAFLLLFAVECGYRPRLSRCAHCRRPLDVASGGRFDVEAGGLCCPDCSSRSTLPVTSAQIDWMKETILGGLTVRPRGEGSTLFDLLRRYVESRLDAVIKPSHLLQG